MGRTRHTETLPGSSRDTGMRDHKRKHPTKERWLLTRKTWRYMADAGRRLIPEGAQNRPEDVPKIESYFQQVCSREPRFLLWRKSSYPGALGFRKKSRSRKKGGSCREKASSADEADTFVAKPTTSGRFDLQRLKQEFLFGSSSSVQGRKSVLPNVPEATNSSPQEEEEDDERELLDSLSRYLRLQESPVETRESEDSQIDYQKLVDQLRNYLSRTSISESPSSARGEKQQQQHDANIRTTSYRPLTPSPTANREILEFGTAERMTLDTLRRYYSKSTCRQKVITDLLTDRKLLAKLYGDLRTTKSSRKGGEFIRTGDYLMSSRTVPSLRPNREGGGLYRADAQKGTDTPSCKQQRPTSLLLSPPPLIEVQPHTIHRGLQTDPVPASTLVAIQMELKKSRETVGSAEEPRETKPETSGAGKRRSSVDNDDVSPSVSDTIKRYLRMARKKSLDSDKVDRFKRVNYDRNLRNIKPKSVFPMPGDDDGCHKGCQTEESWVVALKELKLEDPCSDSGEEVSGSRVTSSRSSLEGIGVSDDGLLSPPSSGILSSGQSFLSSLLHGLQQHSEMTHSVGSAAPTTMQKSKSSSSVVHHGSRLVAKNIWRRTRSKSQSRATAAATCTWTPQVSVMCFLPVPHAVYMLLVCFKYSITYSVRASHVSFVQVIYCYSVVSAPSTVYLVLII